MTSLRGIQRTERSAACRSSGARSYRSVALARPAAARGCGCRSTGQTDRQTDGHWTVTYRRSPLEAASVKTSVVKSTGYSK